MSGHRIQQHLRQLQRSKPVLIAVVSAVGFGLAALFQIAGVLEVAELKLLDVRFLSGYRAEREDNSVVLAAIDQSSLTYFQKQGQSWPWPREFYAALVRYLTKAGARIIAFDIDFSQPDFDRLNVDAAESDKAFADALKENGRSLLAVYLSESDTSASVSADIHAKHFLRVTDAHRHAIPAYQSAEAPLPMFQEGSAKLGVVNFQSDRDGIARRVPLLCKLGEKYLPYFGLGCFLLSKGITNLDSLLERIPVANDGTFLLYWYGKGGPQGAFKYYPIAALIASAIKVEQGEVPDIPPDELRDKHIIIGASAAGLLDFKPTPFTPLEPYPGMEIHATMLANLLNAHYLRQPPRWAEYLLAACLALVAAVSFFMSSRVSVSVVLTLMWILLYLAVAYLLFVFVRWWMPVAFPLTALALVFALSAVVSYATEGSQKRELRKVFNRYLSPRVIDSIIANPDEVELGGKEIEATVFFSDIEGFTSISETLSPKELVRFLNEYFTVASRIILDREAMVDKYIGDAIMAIFGAPIPKDLHAASACLTALEIQRQLQAFYKKKSANLPHFQTRIGLNSGKMVIGNIGSEMHMDYTVIGDAVNLASRLEGVNKEYGTNIIISESTYQQAKDLIEARELDYLRVKGKAIPIRIYELLCEKGGLSPMEQEKVERFAEALSLYRKQQWEKAIKCFEEILKLFPDDGPSKTYIRRCQMLAEETLPEDWDGVYVMKTK